MWLKAPTSFMRRLRSIPPPNTSPDMSSWIPTTVKSSIWMFLPSSRKWRSPTPGSPRRWRPSPPVVVVTEPPEAKASPSQKLYFAERPLAMSEKVAALVRRDDEVGVVIVIA